MVPHCRKSQTTWKWMIHGRLIDIHISKFAHWYVDDVDLKRDQKNTFQLRMLISLTVWPVPSRCLWPRVRCTTRSSDLQVTDVQDFYSAGQAKGSDDPQILIMYSIQAGKIRNKYLQFRMWQSRHDWTVVEVVVYQSKWMERDGT